MGKTGLQIALTEPVVFLRGPATGEDSRGRRALQRDDVPPALLRGVLTLKLAKASRVKRIDITLEGKSRTEWPEGIGARRTETFEEHPIFEATTNFFDGSVRSASTRRAISIGPGVRGETISDEEQSMREWQEHMGRGFGAQPGGEGREGGGGVLGLSNGGSEGRTGTIRGRARDPTHGRSASIMPSSTTHSRRPSFDASATAIDEAQTALGERGRPSYTTHLRFQDPISISHRGPSPAYSRVDSTHNSPAIHTIPLGSPTSEYAPSRPSSITGSSRPPSVHGHHSSHSPHPSSLANALSPITSAPNSGPTSRESSAGGATVDLLSGTPGGGYGREPIEETIYETGAQRPARPANTEHHSSSASLHPDQYFGNSHQHSSSDQQHFNTFNSLYDHSSSPTRPGNSRRGSGLAAASNGNSPSMRVPNLPSLSNHTSPAVSRRQSQDFSNGFSSPSALPAHLTPEDHPHSRPKSSRSRSRFNMSAVSSTLRGLSQDIKDRVHLDRHHSNGHHSNHGSQDRTGSGGFGGSGTGGFGPSSESQPSTSREGSGGTSRGRRASPTRADGGGSRDHSRTRTRGRNVGTKLLGGLSPDEPSSRSSSKDNRGRSSARTAAQFDDDEEVGDGWREFRKGTYHYPISFTIPVSTPPTIHADFGSVVYRLKATVTRSGALTSNLSDEKEVMMVACPGEDEGEVTENVVVERQWEEQLRYVVALSGKSFPIGGQIPLAVRLMPLEKCKIYRISVLLEEKIDYFAHDKKVARHEATRRYQLLALKSPIDPATGKAGALLPIDTDTPESIGSSPLVPLAVQAAETGMDEDDAVSALMNGTGPWLLDHNVQVPDCSSKIHFTTKHGKTNMTVAHWLKVVFRVERGDDVALDAKGKRKQFDIIIETPITILDCRCNVQYIALPSYAFTSNASSTTDNADSPRPFSEDARIATCTCQTSAEQASARQAAAIASGSSLPGTPVSSLTPPGAEPVVGGPMRAATLTLGGGSGTGGGGGPTTVPSAARHASPGPRYLLEEEAETVRERSDQFARLVSGEETATGEIPPSYEDVLQGRTNVRSISVRPESSSRSRSRVHHGERRTASPMPMIRG